MAMTGHSNTEMLMIYANKRNNLHSQMDKIDLLKFYIKNHERLISKFVH